MTRKVGLRNIVSTRTFWFYLLFYDIDKPEITSKELEKIDRHCRRNNISYILYKTKHGFHFIGLSLLTPFQWGCHFPVFQIIFNSYYSGQTIRLSRKQDEIQQLVRIELNYGKVIPNLYNLYCSRFNLEKIPWQKETAEYVLIFEKYRTAKE